MKKVLSLFIITSGVFLFTLIGQAQILTNPGIVEETTNLVGQRAGFSDISIGTIISYIVSAVLALLGIIFLILIIISGFKWMTASGNDEQVKKSLETIKSALIGLIIVLAAYAITNFVFSRLPFSGGRIGDSNPSQVVTNP